MIIIHSDKVNGISQRIYDETIHGIDLLFLTCPHCNHTGTVVHAYYSRKVKYKDDVIRLKILRVKCLFCDKTHALLPDTLIPYSRVTMKDTADIILADTSGNVRSILQDNLSLDMDDIYRIKRNYRMFWKERMTSFRLRFDRYLARNCIQIFKRQFMQIACTLCGSYG